MNISRILLVAILCLALSYNVQAICCFTSTQGYCADGTIGTPCCGYGPCNIFCCNCDGGCRQPRSITKSFTKEAFGYYLEGKGIASPQVADYLFAELDTNKDGKIDGNEVATGKNTPVEKIPVKDLNDL
jgi:hypothetical protein